MVALSCPLTYVLLLGGVTARALEFDIPSSPPITNSSATIESNPLGISIEFYSFPKFLEWALTESCLAHLNDAMGEATPIRIGGVTQDRAVYNSSLASATNYTGTSLPTYLSFGDSFIELAASYNGSVILGLNRRLNDVNNTIAAAELALSEMRNLYAIELGNEPNLWTTSDPIAGGSWSYSLDAASEVLWQKKVGEALGITDFVQAGVFSGNSGSYTIQELSAEVSSAGTGQYIRTYCHHYYAQSSTTANLTTLMSHESIVAGAFKYQAQVDAAESANKPYLFGETNSVSGGGAGVSPTYGAGLWILDYMMQGLLVGSKGMYFHQGITGSCQYCWWGSGELRAPFYGAYTAALALSGASKISQLDNGTGNYAAYAIYDSTGAASRVLLYNSEYYASGTRSSVSFTLTGISASSVNAKRLTADTSDTQIGLGSITIAGQSFVDTTCQLTGTETIETTAVTSGAATFSVQASEALLIYL
ncbi:hypothetical protein BJX65DRAFT_310425 [Aspergillus insuetus]